MQRSVLVSTRSWRKICLVVKCSFHQRVNNFDGCWDILMLLTAFHVHPYTKSLNVVVLLMQTAHSCFAWDQCCRAPWLLQMAHLLCLGVFSLHLLAIQQISRRKRRKQFWSCCWFNDVSMDVYKAPSERNHSGAKAGRDVGWLVAHLM